MRLCACAGLRNLYILHMFEGLFSLGVAHIKMMEGDKKCYWVILVSVYISLPKYLTALDIIYMSGFTKWCLVST